MGQAVQGQGQEQEQAGRAGAARPQGYHIEGAFSLMLDARSALHRALMMYSKTVNLYTEAALAEGNAHDRRRLHEARKHIRDIERAFYLMGEKE